MTSICKRKNVTRNKCIATRNKCHASSNKKLLVVSAQTPAGSNTGLPHLAWPRFACCLTGEWALVEDSTGIHLRLLLRTRNILHNRQGEVKLTDFGIAKAEHVGHQVYVGLSLCSFYPIPFPSTNRLLIMGLDDHVKMSMCMCSMRGLLHVVSGELRFEAGSLFRAPGMPGSRQDHCYGWHLRGHRHVHVPWEVLRQGCPQRRMTFPSEGDWICQLFRHPSGVVVALPCISWSVQWIGLS